MSLLTSTAFSSFIGWISIEEDHGLFLPWLFPSPLLTFPKNARPSLRNHTLELGKALENGNSWHM